ncbi:hypothetical protein GCM10009119_38300 [Algoriphagus jejuensis]|uniref:Polymerase nucleotidyl transferase domain-containing protein n=1 Tax=Algoriphagus jejuensis TaxID=419934 RepID=A0ABP3YKB8_9BACT
MYQAKDTETELHQQKPIMAARFTASRVGYVGLHVTGLQTKCSDLDLLIDFSMPIGWEFFT